MQETLVHFLSWEDPLEKQMATHSSTLAWKFHGQRSLESYSPRGRKARPYRNNTRVGLCLLLQQLPRGL